ncbi:MAG: haloacid dehalogenase, partial [Chloroflexi bacterium]
MIRALIFDFDGLMLDTEGPDYRAWQEVFEEYGHTLPLSTWSDCIGRSADWFDPLDELERHLGAPLQRDEILERRALRHQELVQAERVLPGVEACLSEGVRLGLRLGVASSSSHEWVAGHLQRLELARYFDCVCCRGDVEQAKPAPDVYLAALDDLGVAGREAIALEDSPNGILAAKRAGLFCVAVPNVLTGELD